MNNSARQQFLVTAAQNTDESPKNAPRHLKNCNKHTFYTKNHHLSEQKYVFRNYFGTFYVYFELRSKVFEEKNERHAETRRNSTRDWPTDVQV